LEKNCYYLSLMNEESNYINFYLFINKNKINMSGFTIR
jgi:hypothetical protein